MRFLRRLLAGRNPTSGWAREPARALRLDVDSGALSGVPLGAAFADLRFLGPGQRSQSDGEIWEFPEPGVAVEAHDGRVVGLFVVPIPRGYFRVQPYRGRIEIDGRPVPYSRLSRERDVVGYFGVPTRRDEDDDETVLFYETERVERQLELTPDGRIAMIAIFPVS